MQKTKLPRGNKVTHRRSAGFLHVEFGTKYDRYSYGGNMGNTYEHSIRPEIDRLIGEEARKETEQNWEMFCDGRNRNDDPSYSWVRILRHKTPKPVPPPPPAVENTHFAVVVEDFSVDGFGGLPWITVDGVYTDYAAAAMRALEIGREHYKRAVACPTRVLV